MGKAQINLPSTPMGWAIHLSKIVKIFHEIHGLDRFPINVADIAQEYSRNVFPDSPITAVDGQRFTGKFEGALIAHPDGNGEWGIFYNSAITSPGRINYTLGHELGHYLLHRGTTGESIHCLPRDMWSWDSAYGRMEAEANQFASFLLMPLDDFRAQVTGMSKPVVHDFEGVRDRYGVSLTAAILKWLEVTSKRAMIVVSRDGFIDWSWSSQPALRSGVFLRARQSVIPLPEACLAAQGRETANSRAGEWLPVGVWSVSEEVFESALFSEYHGMAISLLIFPNEPSLRSRWSRDEEGPRPFDTFDQFQRNS